MRAAVLVTAVLLLPAAAPAEAKSAAPAKSRCSVATGFVPGGKARAGVAAWRRAGRARSAAGRRCFAGIAPKAAPGAPSAAGGGVAEAPAGPAEAPAKDAAPPAAASVCIPGPSPWLGAIAEDVGGFRLRLTRTCMRAGRVLIDFQNRDLQPHNLYAEGIEPKVAPKRIAADLDGDDAGESETQLAAGSWRIYCAIDGHEAMTQRLDVVGP